MMSDQRSHDVEDLPELPDEALLAPQAAGEDLPEMPDDVLAELGEEAVRIDAPAESGAAAAPPGAGSGEKPPLRELDKAPAHLRQAAKIAVVGSLLPWMGSGAGWVSFVAGKLVALIGVWFWYKQVEHNWGPKLPGAMGKLADLSFVPKKKEEDDKKSKRRSKQQAATSLSHPFPTALHVLSLLTILAASVALPMVDPAGGKWLIAAAEIGMLTWAAYTWVHIFAYERWGNFNPLFPLMFLGLLFAGATRAIFGLGDLGNLMGIAGVAGGAIVAAGGGLAAYTIVEALMEAKKEGDRKKQEAFEARKAARKSRRGS